MKNILLYFAFLTLFASACNLTKDVNIELPEYDRQPVVECYLEPGKPFRLLLSQSYSFFDPLGLDSSFLNKTLLQDATVSIIYNGQRVNLINQFSFEPSPLKLFNYTAQEIVPETVGTEYTLEIKLPDGNTIAGKTIMLPKVPIDSIVIQFSPTIDTLARALTYITDDLAKSNSYRRLLHYKSLDSLAQQDFITNDRISTTASVVFGTGYDLVAGDTIFNTIYHISPEYYDYLESVQLAIASGFNPFSQPSPIKSTVTGTSSPLGIFTCLVYDQRRTIVAK